VRQRIEAVLDWATVKGFREGPNPARWKGHLSKLLPAKGKISTVTNLPAIPYEELPAVMETLRRRPEIAARALEFNILTAIRPGALLGATSAEIVNKIWTVPASRMKATGRERKKKDFRVPLSDAAFGLVEHADGPLFPGLERDDTLNLLHEIGRTETVHGTARASFKTWASEETSFTREIVEAALAHDVGDETEQAYQRGDMLEKRRALMTAWTRFLSTPSANVIKLVG